jgi:ATP-dependent exoDNAse (exonuclease V) beta subunit
MSFNELEDPYLHHFSDLANDFDLNRGPDLKAFIEHFELEGYRSSVQLPESDRAIKIMSIHKSKGLEFPIVILPKMNFSNDIISTSKFLVEEKGFILYSTLSSKSNVDAIVEMKGQESLQILTDNMNKCYVALTRPVERLYIHNQFGKKGGGFGKMFHQNLCQLTENDDKKITFEVGVQSSPHEVKVNMNQFFTPKNITDQLWFPSIALQDAIALEEYQLTEAQRFGNQIHEMLAEINSKEEISIYIEQGIKEGIIELGFKEQLKEQLNLIFNFGPYNQLFEDSIDVFNEYSIITEGGNVLRPDKVIFGKEKVIILDYKSGLPKKKDNQQVTNYVNAFIQMQDKPVEGYLFYIANMEIVKVC